MERAKRTMSFVIPVRFAYNGKNYVSQMGPFNHSTEREFALTVNRRAIDDCTSLEQLKPVTKNLLEGWSSMQTAVQDLMLENIKLRQALDKSQLDMSAAEELLVQASAVIDDLKGKRQSGRARRNLWPW
jgi:hypothetical protein